MKKLVVLILCLLLTTAMFVSCGGNDTPEETKAPLANAVQTEEDTEETTSDKSDIYTNYVPTKLPKDPSEYDFSHTFKAPEGNPRDIVYDYMYKMATVEWVATKTWNTHWKVQGDFGVDLTYEQGKTYYGLPYSNTMAPLDEFNLYLVDGTFTPNSEYFEELVGNHCSSSMVMAFQQVIDLTYSGALKPLVSRTGLLMFPEGLEIPPARDNSTNPDNWISETMFAHNGQDAVFEGYATLDKGDILYKNIDGSGHTRLVSKVEIFKSPTGKLMPNRSYVYCLEQTNAWFDKNTKNTTWWIDKKYSFDTLWDTFFMPVTLCIYHEENPVIDDAYIVMEGKNSADTITKTLKGTVESNFPLSYVRLTIKDSTGKIVSEKLHYALPKSYKVNLRNFHYDLGLDKLPAGTYTYTLRAGIARGGVDIETFNFTIG